MTLLAHTAMMLAIDQAAMMTPTDPTDVLKWLGAILVSVFGFLLNRSISRVESDIKEKADAAHMAREITRLEVQLQDAHSVRKQEITRLEVQLQETREARERDIERIERASAEKFNEFSESMRDRLNSLERNLDQRLTLILQAVSNERRV